MPRIPASSWLAATTANCSAATTAVTHGPSCAASSRRFARSRGCRIRKEGSIFMRNVERFQAWYADVLGLHTYGARPGRVAFMAADLEQSHEIALVQVGDDAPGAL